MFATHTSVRLMGAESVFEPQCCRDESCTRADMHMHCPFCVSTEIFTDQQIIRAHYQVKHVDKGIEFAGLKMLRCCDRCDIIGSIKGNKDIKRPHWHCYSCKNGFNRRDEALKHYRTHFKSPQAAFQLKISQEVYNTSLGEGSKQSVKNGGFISMVPVCEYLQEQHSANLNSGILSKSLNTVQATVAANETVDGAGEIQPIFVVHHNVDDIIDSSIDVVNKAPACDIDMDIIDESGGEVYQVDWSADVAPSHEDEALHADTEFNPSLMRVSDHKRIIEELRTRRDKIENDLRSEILELRQMVEDQSKEIERLQKREFDLTNSDRNSCTESNDSSVLLNMKKEYEEMLRRHLAQLNHIGCSNGTSVEQNFKSSSSESIFSTTRSKLSAPAATSLSKMVIVASGSRGKEIRILPYRISTSRSHQSSVNEEKSDRVNSSTVTTQSNLSSDQFSAESQQYFSHAETSVSNHFSQHEFGVGQSLSSTTSFISSPLLRDGFVSSTSAADLHNQRISSSSPAIFSPIHDVISVSDSRCSVVDVTLNDCETVCVESPSVYTNASELALHDSNEIENRTLDVSYSTISHSNMSVDSCGLSDSSVQFSTSVFDVNRHIQPDSIISKEGIPVKRQKHDELYLIPIYTKNN